MSEELYKKALAKVKEYRGESATLGGGGPMAELAPEIERLKDELLWGAVWSDPAIDIKTRSLCTISALIVLGKDEQLGNHIGWALNIGITKEQIVSLIMQMMVYGGLPTAHCALNVANEVFKKKI